MSSSEVKQRPYLLSLEQIYWLMERISTVRKKELDRHATMCGNGILFGVNKTYLSFPSNDRYGFTTLQDNMIDKQIRGLNHLRLAFRIALKEGNYYSHSDPFMGLKSHEVITAFVLTMGTPVCVVNTFNGTVVRYDTPECDHVDPVHVHFDGDYYHLLYLLNPSLRSVAHRFRHVLPGEDAPPDDKKKLADRATLMEK